MLLYLLRDRAFPEYYDMLLRNEKDFAYHKAFRNNIIPGNDLLRSQRCLGKCRQIKADRLTGGAHSGRLETKKTLHITKSSLIKNIIPGNDLLSHKLMQYHWRRRA